MDESEQLPIRPQAATADDDTPDRIRFRELQANREQIERDLLLIYLHNRDVHCPACGYNMRNATVTACTECGRVLRMGIEGIEQASHPALTKWSYLLFLLTLPAGLGLVFIWVLFQMKVQNPDQTRIRILFFGFIATIPLAVIVLSTRRKFLLLRSGSQTLLLLMAIALVVFLYLVLIWSN